MLIEVHLAVAASAGIWGILLKKMYDAGVPLWIIIIVAVIVVIAYSVNSEKSTTTSLSTPSVRKSQKQANPKNEKTEVDDEIPVQFVASSEEGKPSNIFLPSGTILQKDHYTILQHISSGGFGNTYFARDNYTAGDVAIKELYVSDKCSRATNKKDVKVNIEANKELFAKFKKKFLKEARRLQIFNHPNIVRVYDCFEENETAYYVMEYLPRMSLAAIIKERGLLTEQRIRILLPGILSALQTVHSEQIWHLDIKPANLVLRDENAAVLIDFGASKQYENKDGRTLNSSTLVAYSKSFAPPEQLAQNTKNFGPWTDIYALGATIFNLLTGQLPPTADDIFSGETPSFPKSTSQEMVNAVLAMMQPDRRKRPQNASEVARLLRL